MPKSSELHPPASRYNPDDLLAVQRAEAQWAAFCKTIDAERAKQKEPSP